MQEIIFKKARNGDLSAISGALPFHSLYNPTQEARTFASSISCDFHPKVLFLLESALSYCTAPLKARFPHSKILSIRFTHAFDEYNKLFDKVFYFNSKNAAEFEDTVLKNISAEDLLAALYITWQPSIKIFKSDYEALTAVIKSITQKAKAILVTKSFFAKKWLLNTLSFCKYIRHTAPFPAINKPVIIAASGPTLNAAIPIIKKWRDKCFLVALSSAILPLTYNNLLADLVITTDGGYYAKKHLYPLLKTTKSAVTCPPSSAIPRSLFENATFTALTYGDDLSHTLIKIWGEQVGLDIPQNDTAPTVSGFALLLLNKITKSDIFICGLDLAQNPRGHNHSLPNTLETDSTIKTNRLNTALTEHTKNLFNAYALSVYRSWFSNLPRDLTKRLFRVMDITTNAPINNICDITTGDLFKRLKEAAISDKNNTSPVKEISLALSNNGISAIKRYIKSACQSSEWLKEISPLKFLQYEKALDTKDSESLKKELLIENSALLKKIERVLDPQSVTQ